MSTNVYCWQDPNDPDEYHFGVKLLKAYCLWFSCDHAGIEELFGSDAAGEIAHNVTTEPRAIDLSLAVHGVTP